MSKRSTFLRMKKIPFLLLLAFLPACGRDTGSGMPAQFGGNSATFHLPQDQWTPKVGPNGKSPRPYQPGPRWAGDLASRYSDIRVKIFPHNSTYAEPEGRESTQDQVQFLSSGKCVAYLAKGATAETAIDRSTAVKSGASMTITLKDLNDPLWIECSGPTKLVRYGAKSSYRYAGNFFVKKVGQKKGSAYLTVVNALPLEQYLKGVVPSEMPASWPKEALRAQAVAARTYALYELTMENGGGESILEKEGAGAQLDDTVGYQAYLGLTNGSASSDQAVEDTFGEVITHQGNLIKAFFHSDSGGHTEDAANVWGVSMPYALGKAEIYPASLAAQSAWEVPARLREVQSGFQAQGLLASAATLNGFSVAAADSLQSGRAKAVTLETSRGGVRVAGSEFTHLLGLRSSLIQFDAPASGTVKIHGRGFGHGVGMSQWGARMMSEHLHKTHQEILTFYYSGVEVGSAP
jgi:stage II sporulation protein D